MCILFQIFLLCSDYKSSEDIFVKSFQHFNLCRSSNSPDIILKKPRFFVDISKTLVLLPDLHGPLPYEY